MFKGLRRKIHFYMVVIGIAVVIAGFIASGMLEKFNETAVETAASIVEIAEPEDNDYSKIKGNNVIVEYSVDGKNYEEKLGYYEEDMIVGQTVMVKYDPENPSEMRPVDGPDTVKIIYIIGAIFIAAGITFSITMAVNERRRADKRAEKRYERKMKKQNKK